MANYYKPVWIASRLRDKIFFDREFTQTSQGSHLLVTRQCESSIER